MLHFNKESIKQLDNAYRLNLINSIPGIKSANLIGTKSIDGVENLAIFSSVVHLGSNPPLLGLVMRPIKEAARHTYHNIISTGYYTINHIAENFIEKAHYTSANFPDGVSEFEMCRLNPEYLAKFQAPFVKESSLKIGMKYLESHHIEANDTIFMVGEILEIFIDDKAVETNGYIDFTNLQSVGISGLNSYYQLKKIKDFPYVRLNEFPNF